MRCASLVIASSLLLTSLPVRAAEPEALVEKGLELRRNRRDAEALALFREAYLARPVPRTRAQIALAEQALGMWVEAERDLQLALAVEDAWIASHRETLRKARETIERHLGTLAVNADAARAKLWVQGVEIGELPIRALRVVAGAVRLEVRAEGYQTATRSVEVAPGATVVESFELEPIAHPAASLPASGSPDAAGANVLSRATESAPAAKAAGTPLPQGADPRRTFAWAALGTAGAFLSGAVAAQIISQESATRYNDDRHCFYGDLSRDERCGVYRGQSEAAQTLANVGYVAAGALGVASAILFWSSSSPTRSGGTQLRVGVGTAGPMLTVSGRL
jgi:hypothetical protein